MNNVANRTQKIPTCTLQDYLSIRICFNAVSLVEYFLNQILYRKGEPKNWS